MRSRPTSGVKVMSALLTAQPGKQEEFLQTLQSLQEEIRQQPGCLECTVGQDTTGESQFLIFMVWKELAYLEAHMDSEAFRILLGATSVLSAPASFRFIAADSAFSQPGYLGRSRRPRASRAEPTV
jgi:quinol monooxygenase YgiN